ncbi:hypothetical protein CY35_11G074800 [Sphagnum magellanicum]|nr:hypothetical protein CY35_11G074800 [Sphagnum magellanicum]
MDDHDDGVHWDYSKNSNNMFAGGSMLVSSKVGLAVGIIITMVVAIVCGWWWHYVLSKESKARTSSNKKAPLPPGSLGLPLLGETLEFLRLTQANRSAEFLNRRVAKYGQVFKTHLLFSPAVSVGAPDGNKFLFANENKLVQNSWPSPVKKLFGPNSLMNKTGEQHKHARRIFTSFFGPDGLQRFVPRMDKMVRAHFVQFWEGKDEIMAFAVIKQFAFALAADLFFSITEGPQFWSLERDLFTLSQGIAQPPLDFPGTAYHNAKLSRNRILCTLDTIICQRRKDMEEGKISSQHDLLSVMISTRDQDQDQLATNEDIKDNILMFLYAGHDTSVSTLAGALKYLFLNPQCLQQVIKEQKEIAIEKAGSPLNWDDTRKMKYTWQVMQECLRVQPALEVGFRECIKEFEYEGFTIPKGWRLFWHLGRSHMSPQFFPNPERFDPDRFEGLGPPPFIYMPFGGGPRICLGAEFARTEMVVFLHYLVLNYEWNMVDPNEGVVRNPLPVFQKGLPLKIRMKQPLEFH